MWFSLHPGPDLSFLRLATLCVGNALVPNPTRRVASGEMIRPASRLPAVNIRQGNNLNIRPESALPSLTS